MSAVQPALTSGEKTALLGPSQLNTYILGIPNVTPYATARIDIGTTLQFPLTDIQVTGASANWLTSRSFMTVWIGTNAGTKDKGVFYLRKAPEAGLLHIGEIQRADSGIETVMDRSTGPIFPGDYITIWETYNLQAMRSQIAYNYGSSTGTFYKNYDVAYGTQNSIPAPYFQGDTHKLYRLPTGSSTIAISLSVTAIPFRSGQSIASYAWAVPSAMTGTSGAGTNTVTGNLPNGVYTFYCLATTNDGATETAIRIVWVYGDTGACVPTPLSLNYSDTRDRTGRKATVELADNLRGNFDPDNMVVVFDEATFVNGTVATLTSKFIGWINNSPGTSEYGKKGSTLEVWGAAAMLAALGSDSQRLQQNNPPTSWQECPYEVLTLTYFIWYLLKWGVVNYTSLFNYYPLDPSVPQSMNPLDATTANYMAQIQALALRAGYANGGCDSDGDLHVHPNPSLVDPSARSGIITRDVLTADLCGSANYVENDRPNNRRVVAGAFRYDGTGGVAQAFPYNNIGVVAMRSQAPGKATGQAAGTEELQGIITDGQNTLDLFVGQVYQMRNARYTQFIFTIPGNRDVYEPAHMTRVNYTLDAAYSPTGATLTGNGIPLSVTKTRDEHGGAKIELTIEVETSGTYGEIFPYPPPVPSKYDILALTPFSAFIPAGGQGTLGTQNNFSPTTAPASQIKFVALAQNAGASEYRVIRVNGISPWNASDISPTSGQRTSLGQAIKLIEDTTSNKRLWLLCAAGIAYTNNYLAASVVWVVNLNSSSNPQKDYDFTLSNQGWTAITGFANYIAGTGWSTVDADRGSAHYYRSVDIEKTISSTTISKVAVTFNLTLGSNDSSANNVLRIDLNGSTVLAVPYSSMVSGNNQTISYVGSTPAVTDIIVVLVASEHGGAPTYSGSALITKIVITDSLGNNISDMAVSSGQNVYWLTKKTVSAVDYVFANFTRDYFKTVFNTQIAQWNANLTYTIQISKYNPAQIWISAGTPGTDAAIYFSSNGAVSFTAGATLNTRGGLFRLPRSLLGGSPNRAAQFIVYIKGVSTNLQAVRDGSSPSTIVSGSSDYPISASAMNSFALNGNYVLVGMKSRDVYGSSDGGLTFAIIATAPGTGNLYSLEVWPTNRKYVVVGGDQTFAYSIDRSATYTNLWSTFSTWAVAQYGAGIATVLLNVIPSFWAVFKKPVT
jgi:hypothetical protein